MALVTTHAFLSLLLQCHITLTVTLEVDLSNRNLNQVPQNINTDVTDLILRYNNIKKIIPSSFDKYVHITELNLDWNGVESVAGDAFYANDVLVTLRIDGHNLISVPEGFGGLSDTLQEIHMDQGLSSMQNAPFVNFFALRKIMMSNTAVEGVISFRDAGTIREFFAQTSSLTAFPDFSSLLNVEVIQLHENSFSYIPVQYVAGLSKLQRLAIPQCGVTSIPDLSHMTSLKFVQFDKNDLQSLPDMYGLPLLELDIAGNPLVCDRALCWIRMWNVIKPSPGLILEKWSGGVAECTVPGSATKQSILGLHPVSMGCYSGKTTQKFQ